MSEAAPEDVVEQALPADGGDDPAPVRADVPLESDPADAVEQSVEVAVDDDAYGDGAEDALR